MDELKFSCDCWGEVSSLIGFSEKLGGGSGEVSSVLFFVDRPGAGVSKFPPGEV
jgi:hypothetical protein